MPELTISEEQQTFIDGLREELQSDLRYGHVRERDALQYVIDNFERDGLDVVATAPPADGSVEQQAAATLEDDGDDDTPEADEADAEAEEDDPADAEDDGTAQSDASDDSASSSTSDDDDRLSAMMNLLDTHEDKWREAEKGDARYEVDMPDETTEYVQTKDDVRAHLFKNY